MELTDLPNIGPVLADNLRRVGITSPEQLRAAGACEAWLRIRAQVDVLMPGAIEERTLLSSLADPQGVTRAEAERCALNVIRFILKLKTI